MAFKDILVHIDNRATVPQRIDAAILLAREFQAHLTGLYVTGRHSAGAPRTQARELFAGRVAAAGVAADWLEFEGLRPGIGVTEAVYLHAHYHDLLIVGQTGSTRGDHSIPAALPGQAVLGAGRPVLVIPYAGPVETIGRRILLAWRGGPESSRAVNDAMPLMKKARSVTILSVKTAGNGSVGPGKDALLGYLARHGVGAEVEEIDPAGLSVGDTLLNRAADLGSDLLVMGAFSQTRRGIPGLGEVGRHLLRYMTIPVLMSH